MNKIIYLAAVLIICAAFSVKAQTDSTERNRDIQQMREELNDLRHQINYSNRQAKIWSKSAPITFHYGTQILNDKDMNAEYKTDLSFGISRKHTYYLHSKAVAGMVKFAADITWWDMSFARFEKGKGNALSNLLGNVTEGNYSNFDDYFNDAYEHALDSDGEIDLSAMLNRINVGKYIFSLSVFGVGPSVKIVPFYPLNSSLLDHIKISAYFQYMPTATGLVFSDPDETVLCGGYMHGWRYGVSLSLGKFGIGFEHRWGNGNLKKINFNDSDDESDAFYIGSSKIKYTTSLSRIYIGFRF